MKELAPPNNNLSGNEKTQIALIFCRGGDFEGTGDDTEGKAAELGEPGFIAKWAGRTWEQGLH